MVGSERTVWMRTLPMDKTGVQNGVSIRFESVSRHGSFGQLIQWFDFLCGLKKVLRLKLYIFLRNFFLLILVRNFIYSYIFNY